MTTPRFHLEVRVLFVGDRDARLTVLCHQNNLCEITLEAHKRTHTFKIESWMGHSFNLFLNAFHSHYRPETDAFGRTCPGHTHVDAGQKQRVILRMCLDVVHQVATIYSVHGAQSTCCSLQKREKNKVRKQASYVAKIERVAHNCIVHSLFFDDSKDFEDVPVDLLDLDGDYPKNGEVSML